MKKIGVVYQVFAKYHDQWHHRRNVETVRYLSQCPSCFTIYHLSLMDINISNGMVRCAQCHYIFDAYSHFIEDLDRQDPPLTNYLTEVLLPKVHDAVAEPDTEPLIDQQDPQKTYFHYVNHYMRQRVEGSQLNLYTYLNYLDTLSPIHGNFLETKNPIAIPFIKSKK